MPAPLANLYIELNAIEEPSPPPSAPNKAPKSSPYRLPPIVAPITAPTSVAGISSSSLGMEFTRLLLATDSAADSRAINALSFELFARDNFSLARLIAALFFTRVL